MCGVWASGVGARFNRNASLPGGDWQLGATRFLSVQRLPPHDDQSGLTPPALGLRRKWCSHAVQKPATHFPPREMSELQLRRIALPSGPRVGRQLARALPIRLVPVSVQEFQPVLCSQIPCNAQVTVFTM